METNTQTMTKTQEEEWKIIEDFAALHPGFLKAAVALAKEMEEDEEDEHCEVCTTKTDDLHEGHTGEFTGKWCCAACIAKDDELADEEDEDEEETFDRKHPQASCLRCKVKVTGATVVLCGGGGGCCETWYCETCSGAGTADCPVCV